MKLEQIINNRILNFWKIEHTFNWIILSIIIKGLLFLFFYSQLIPKEISGIIGNWNSDTGLYINPIENFISNGTYDPDFRMPGYGFIYFLFRVLFSKVVSLNCIVILQFLIEAISVYYLAKLAYLIFKSAKLFYLVFSFYLINVFVTALSIEIMPDSFVASALIFGTYFYVKHLKKNNIKNALFSGMFFCWAVFMRPVYIPILIIFGLFGLFYFIFRKRKIVFLLESTLIFFSSFIIIDSMWIVHNYTVNKKFIFLQDGVFPGHGNPDNFWLVNLYRFVQSWGGDFVHWNPKAEIRFFGVREVISKGASSLSDDYTLPINIYTSQFNYDSLLKIRDYITMLKVENSSSETKEMFNKIVVNTLKKYRLSVIDEKPFLYYVYAPLKIFKKFLFHSGTYNLFNKKFENLNFIQKIYKYFMSGFYIYIVIVGILGLVFLLYPFRIIEFKNLISLHILFTLITIPIILRFANYRYLVPAYPFIVISAAIVSEKIFLSFLYLRNKLLINK